MKRRLTISFYLLLTWQFVLSNSNGNDPFYPYEDIPQELLERAHIVYREYDEEFTILGEGRAEYRNYAVVTILDKTGSGHAVVSAWYDKLRKVSRFTAKTYDRTGKEIYTLKKEDILDESHIDGNTMYDDSRIMQVDLRQNSYPYTIEYEIVYQYKYLYSIPDGVIVDGENDAIQHRTYSLSYPKELKPRIKQINFDDPPTETQHRNDETLTWEFSDIAAVEFEPFSRGYYEVSPIIKAAPSAFNYEGYEGSMNTWDDLARWQNSLNAGRDNLSESRKAAVGELVANATSTREKVQMIYEYMQSRTRYVSIQLGVGGFQPFETALVDEKGYGDCKALSFYTQSLLAAVGIESYYSWIYGGKNPPPVDEDFPDDTFNHIILFVPMEKDTVWLECTSQTNPMGYLGDFTSDRDAFVIQGDQGKIIHTPKYELENNAIYTKAAVALQKNGDAIVDMNTTFNGMAVEHESLHAYLKLTETDHKKWLRSHINYSNYEIVNYKFDHTKKDVPKIDLSLELALRNVASISEKRLIFNPNIFRKKYAKLSKTKVRRSPVYLTASKIEQDTLVITIPEGLRVEYLPDPQTITTVFGEYICSYSINEDNHIVYTRKFSLKKGSYSSESYHKLVEFMRKVNSLDKKKVLLNKNT